jgi:Na+:H+ antiporter, NhaA family
VTGSPARRAARRLLPRGTWRETQLVAEALRTETLGGALLLAAALAAMVWANSPWFESYAALRDWEVGPASLHLDLSLAEWSADALLAVFFFVAGLELKRELLVGDLREPAKAALPVAAALCGVAVPALVYAATVLVAGAGGDALRGWAIPAATDIAFALAVLAVIGTHLPAALRSFLLTLAVVDDLVAITIIAVFFTASLDLAVLALAVIPLAGYGVLVQLRVSRWWLLAPLAALTWGLVHASGVHPTVAGVLLALTVPVRPRNRGHGARLASLPPDTDLALRFEHGLRPLSAGVAVPVFAFFAAGVRVAGGGVGDAFRDEAAVGVALGLVVGKLLGVFGGTWLFARFTRAELDEDLGWWDVAGLAQLAGIGFTVSLLVGELAFGAGSPRAAHVKLAVLAGTVTSALVASVILRRRNAAYRRLAVLEARDDDGDGVPDVFQASDVEHGQPR